MKRKIYDFPIYRSFDFLINYYFLGKFMFFPLFYFYIIFFFLLFLFRVRSFKNNFCLFQFSCCELKHDILFFLIFKIELRFCLKLIIKGLEKKNKIVT
jgi:hypothetical protein